MARPRRPKGKELNRKPKKKVSVLTSDRIEYVDWKDVNTLRRFVSDRAKIRARRVTGNDTQQQREIAAAVKNAREMALLPYTNRVTTQRGGRSRDDDRGGRRDDRRDDRRSAASAGEEAPVEFEALDAPESGEGTEEVEGS